MTVSELRNEEDQIRDEYNGFVAQMGVVDKATLLCSWGLCLIYLAVSMVWNVMRGLPVEGSGSGWVLLWLIVGVPVATVAFTQVSIMLRRAKFWRNHFELQERYRASQAAQVVMKSGGREGLERQLQDVRRMREEATLRLRAKGVPNNLLDLTRVYQEGDPDAAMWLQANDQVPLLEQALLRYQH